MSGIAELDLRDPAFVADPYPTYAALRAQGPLQYHERSDLWLALGHAHAAAVLRERRLGRLWRDREPLDELEPFNMLHRHQMMENEPPEHTRLRRLVAQAFARGHVERLRPRVEQITHELVDAVATSGSADLIADVAAPLPVAVIAELLGVPASDRPLLRPWSDAIVRMYEYDRTPRDEAAAVSAATEFASYVRALLRRRRQAARDDLLTHLAAAQQDGVGLSEDEAVASAVLLLNAGHEASVNVLGNGMVALLRCPEQLDRLRADPALAPAAVEEMIRYDPPLHLFERTATAAVELGGMRLPAGAKVAALLGSANRDPAVFAAPERFDITRTPNPHLGFGAGIHFCLGAPLARLELTTALPILLARMPDLQLLAEPVPRPRFVIRGYQSIRVAFTPRR